MTNVILENGFSNPESEKLYHKNWPDEQNIRKQKENGGQCGACSSFAPLNPDWGVCCSRKSRHFKETVFEHFSCSDYRQEGWGAHSFKERFMP